MADSTPKKKFKFSKADKVENRKRLIVVLEYAFLETVKSKRNEGAFELLNCDDHITLMKKMNREYSEARPDIVHQIYIHTKKHTLIEVNPQTRIPRTFKRFAGLMVQLLHELKISSVATEGGSTLLKVIKNPVTQYFPAGCRKIACTSDASKLINLQSFVASLEKPEEPIVVMIGAHARGSDEVEYADQYICFSNYPLSAALACAKVTNAFEQLWGVL